MVSGSVLKDFGVMKSAAFLFYHYLYEKWSKLAVNKRFHVSSNTLTLGGKCILCSIYVKTIWSNFIKDRESDAISRFFQFCSKRDTRSTSMSRQKFFVLLMNVLSYNFDLLNIHTQSNCRVWMAFVAATFFPQPCLCKCAVKHIGCEMQLEIVQHRVGSKSCPNVLCVSMRTPQFLMCNLWLFFQVALWQLVISNEHILYCIVCMQCLWFWSLSVFSQVITSRISHCRRFTSHIIAVFVFSRAYKCDYSHPVCTVLQRWHQYNDLDWVWQFSLQGSFHF